MTIKLKHKFASETGASFLMGLLLFLVCTTIASITIAAATGVAGRWSEINNRDKSYYNVTSAAKLFWDELESGNVSVTIIRSADVKESGSANDLSSWELSVDCMIPDAEGNKRYQITEDAQDSVGLITLNEDTATLFQILSSDLVLYENYGSDATRPLECVLNSDTTKMSALVAPTISAEDLTPVERQFQGHTYESFSITEGGGGNHLDTVDVMVSQNNDSTYDYGTYNFVFIEQGKTDSFRCTLVAQANINNAIPHVRKIEDGQRYEWVTTVTWAPLSLNVGGAS